MKRYKFLTIGYSVRHKAASRGVDIYCTDPLIIDWLVEEVTRYIPKTKGRFGRKGLDGNFNFIQLYQLGGKDYEIAHWLFRRACEEGWRPVDASAPEVEMFHRMEEIAFKLFKEEEV